MTESILGKEVKKTKGYFFEGTVVSEFKNSLNQDRYVVEHKGSSTKVSAGMLHIFNRNQFELV